MIKIGDFQLNVIETGRFGLDGGAMFGVVPKVLWEKTNPPDSKNRIPMALRTLLIRGKGRAILVDTGIGENWDPSLAERYAIDHRDHRLETSLADVGVRAHEITDVILTHLHFDHVGGCTRLNGKGEVELTFPKARYWVHEKNLSHAHAPSEKDRASFLKNTIEPVVNSPQLKVSKGDEEIASGVRLWITHGHTPGQQLVQVHGDGRTVLFCGDTIPTSSHIPIPYVMAYDVEPMRTIDEKRDILDKAAKENWILVFSHDPMVRAATVRNVDGRYQREKFSSLGLSGL